jgi:hypothetical protein
MLIVVENLDTLEVETNSTFVIWNSRATFYISTT